MSERFGLISAPFVFFERDGKVLFFRRLAEFGKDKFDVPSGHLEKGETFKQAACREVMEEVGVTINPDDLELIHVMERPAHNYFYIFFRLRTWSGEPRIMEPDQHADLMWCIPGEQPNPMPHTQAAWERAQAGERWSVWTEDSL